MDTSTKSQGHASTLLRTISLLFSWVSTALSREVSQEELTQRFHRVFAGVVLTPLTLAIALWLDAYTAGAVTLSLFLGWTFLSLIFGIAAQSAQTQVTPRLRKTQLATC